MTWSTKTPEVAGFYWIRRTQSGSTKYSAQLVEITGRSPFFTISVLGPTFGKGYSNYKYDPANCEPVEWAGPIPEPEDA